MTNGITKVEVKKRAGYILLGIFAGIGITPVREWFVENIPVNPLWICIVGIIGTLYFFDFG